MKISSIFRVLITGFVTSNLFIDTLALVASQGYEAELEKYAKQTKVISGGRYGGSEVSVRVGGHGFFENIPDSMGTIGLYAVAVYKNEVLLTYHYNTYFDEGASEDFARYIEKVPDGIFVVVAAKEEPTRLFNEEGQNALYSIGAVKGSLKQECWTSYLCLGIKGLRKGQAIENVGVQLLEHVEPNVDKPTNLSFQKRNQEPAVRAEMFKIYDPSVGEKETWSINDHCFIRDKNGIWHMFGITHPVPNKPEVYGSLFAHATAERLTQVPWVKRPYALKADPKLQERHLWAPHIILHDGLYYMYYCAGGQDHTKYKIHLATSKDLIKWKRHPRNPMIVDGFDARDPFILKVGNEWVMYYTATRTPSGGANIVAYQTSQDLIHWHNRRIAFQDRGPTESPTVVRRGEYYYLFIGPRGGYVGTDVFRSRNPFKWELKDKVAHIRAHAAEVIRDVDGKWYVSHCGIGLGGLYLAHLYWQDGQDDSDTSLPIPK